MDSSQKKHIFNITSREKENEKGIFLKRVGMLLEGGYSLKEALSFLIKFERGITKHWIKSIQDGLRTGTSFHQELEKNGFSEKICSQIYLANQYGRYAETITLCGEQLLEALDRKKRLRSITAYPLFLLMFLMGMLLLMRYMILPHMQTLFSSIGSSESIFSNGMMSLVFYSPQIIGLFLLVILISMYIIYKKMQTMSIIQKYAWLTTIPILNNYLKDYLTQFFFFEWGNLLISGCSFQEIVSIMRGDQASNILKETGTHMSIELNQGKTIHETINTLPFFYKEGIQVVSHGENLGKLGVEMLVYANYCENQFIQRIEKMMERIQPVVFILIGVMILIIYAALMLPVFSLMEGF